jgi:hypothetical protein
MGIKNNLIFEHQPFAAADNLSREAWPFCEPFTEWPFLRY